MLLLVTIQKTELLKIRRLRFIKSLFLQKDLLNLSHLINRYIKCIQICALLLFCAGHHILHGRFMLTFWPQAAARGLLYHGYFASLPSI
jgi:hypothetical protein